MPGPETAYAFSTVVRAKSQIVIADVGTRTTSLAGQTPARVWPARLPADIRLVSCSQLVHVYLSNVPTLFRSGHE